MASLTASVGDLAMVTSGLLQPVVVPVPGLSGASGTSQGAASVDVEGTGAQLGDDAGNLLQDLVMRGAKAGVLESATPGDATLAPRSTGAVGQGISGLVVVYANDLE
jgi:hypothetical protein